MCCGTSRFAYSNFLREELLKRDLQVNKRLFLISTAIKVFAKPEYHNNNQKYSDYFSNREMYEWLSHLILEYGLECDFSKHLIIHYLNKLIKWGYLRFWYHVNRNSGRKHRLYYLTYEGYSMLQKNHVFRKIKGQTIKLLAFERIYDIIAEYGPISVNEIMQKDGCSLRCVNYAIKYLLDIGCVEKDIFFSDLRQSRYQVNLNFVSE